MRKFTLLAASVFIAILSLTACKELPDLNQAKHRISDSLFKAYPNVPGHSIDLDSYPNINIVVRSKQLYNTTGENKEQITAEIGAIAQSVFGTNNELDKGQLIFTQDERGTDMDPRDGQKYPITFTKP